MKLVEEMAKVDRRSAPTQMEIDPLSKMTADDKNVAREGVETASKVVKTRLESTNATKQYVAIGMNYETNETEERKVDANEVYNERLNEKKKDQATGLFDLDNVLGEENVNPGKEEEKNINEIAKSFGIDAYFKYLRKEYLEELNKPHLDPTIPHGIVFVKDKKLRAERKKEKRKLKREKELKLQKEVNIQRQKEKKILMVYYYYYYYLN